MNSYVIDASIVIQRFIQDIHSNQVKILFNGLKQSDELVVPEFCLLECSNIFWKHARFNGMPLSIIEFNIDDLIQLPLTIYSVTDLLKHGVQIGLRHQLATYDSIYIALAKKLKYPLITDDNKQSIAALAEGVIVKPITDFGGIT
jgi:predicted nucleic acid-binding protein